MKFVLASLVAFALLQGRADPTVSDVVVNQRWPWSEKVDVDFTLTGGASDVRVTATWDGQDAPYELGTLLGAKSGRNRLTWDPGSSLFAGRVLAGFAVSAEPIETPTNRYLIIDLEAGGVSYAAKPDGSDGRWTDEYKSKKMVFRRIPAGTYVLGIDSNRLAYVNGGEVSGTFANACSRHTDTFTSDFYVGVFKMTVAQYNQLNGPKTAQYPLRAKVLSYNEIRGVTNSINWPKTGYAVATNSLLAKLRAKAGPADFNIDLCHECQWEIAMRAGTMTFWPNGGTTDDSRTALTNLVDAIGWRGTSQHNVGEKFDNGWGIYDGAGLQPEWTLSAASRTGNTPKKALADATDPTGPELTTADRRVVRGSGDSKLMAQLPCYRQLGEPHRETASARFCIHLKPLVAP